MQKNVFLFLITLLYCSATQAKVDAKNYDFTLDKLYAFYPGKSVDEIKKNFPKIENVKSDGSLMKLYFKHVRYRFPIFLQVYNGTVVSFFARLPNYFLHDVFHQSLINRYGKQNSYKKVNSAAIYTWNNAKNNKIIYKGECTITCFPSYLYVSYAKSPGDIPAGNILDELSVL